MGLGELINTVELVGIALSLKTKAIECYLFGSVLKHYKTANDVDVLLLYDNIISLEIAKLEFKKLTNYYPSHFTYLTFDEELELMFLKSFNSKLIFKI